LQKQWLLTWSVRVQCQLLEPDRSGFQDAEFEQLSKRLGNMQTLMLDADEFHMRENREQPANWHFIPYKTNIHYVPKRPGHDVAIAGPLQPWMDWPQYSVERVAPPPPAAAWAPRAMTRHARPVLMMYVGFHSRVRTLKKLKTLPLWRLKRKMRSVRRRIGCAGGWVSALPCLCVVWRANLPGLQERELAQHASELLAANPSFSSELAMCPALAQLLKA
jgi:hypothetical protein